MIIQPITKAKYIINIVKSVGKDIDYALDIVAWYTMTDDEEEQVKQSIINNWHTQLFNIYLGIIKNTNTMKKQKKMTRQQMLDAKLKEVQQLCPAPTRHYYFVDYAACYGGYRLVMVNESNGGHSGAFGGNGCEERINFASMMMKLETIIAARK